MIVADASPLIVLAKLQHLGLLNALYSEVLMGSVVKAETIDAGRAVHALGVEQMEVAMEGGWLQTVRLTAQERDLMQRLTERSRLDRGEAEAIALASVRSLRLVVDDKEARNAAAAAGVEHVGTAGTLLEAYLQKRLNLGELEVMIRNLSQILWLSPAVVAEILRLTRKVKR